MLKLARNCTHLTSESSLTRDRTQAIPGQRSERAVSGVLTIGLPGKCIDNYSFVV